MVVAWIHWGPMYPSGCHRSWLIVWHLLQKTYIQFLKLLRPTVFLLSTQYVIPNTILIIKLSALLQLFFSFSVAWRYHKKSLPSYLYNYPASTFSGDLYLLNSSENFLVAYLHCDSYFPVCDIYRNKPAGVWRTPASPLPCASLVRLSYTSLSARGEP